MALASGKRSGGVEAMNERQYLPTFSELVDRLSIITLKSIFISENRSAYLLEREQIEHDIDLLLHRVFTDRGKRLAVKEIRAIMMIMLANRYIWENENKARAGGAEQNAMLRATHSINGVRNTAKNVLAEWIGERVDLKVDCLAAELEKDFGNWNVFE